MAYIPDNLGERRRAENVSQTAFEFYIKYCQFADQDTGLTLANTKTCADAFNMRSDNAQKYDSELQDKKWIEVIIDGNRTYRKMLAGWIPRTERQKKQQVKFSIKDDLLNFRKELNRILNLRKNSYILGELPKFKEKLLNFRKTYKEYIDQPNNQLIDQLFDQIQIALEAAQKCVTETDPVNFSDSDDEKPAEPRTAHETPKKLSPDFSTSAQMLDWAARNAKDVDAQAATMKFANYWSTIAPRNNLRTEAQWLKTWENWMIDQQTAINEQKRRTAVWQDQQKENQQNGNGARKTAGDLIKNRNYR